jgi:ribonuclease P protein component
LAAAHRLRRRDEFAATIRTGRRVSRGVLVVHLSLPTEELPNELPEVNLSPVNLSAEPPRRPEMGGRRGMPARAGLVVSRAVGPAVQRNLVKRRLRHLAAALLPGLPEGAQLVVRALPGAAQATFTTLADSLDQAVQAARRARPRYTGRAAAAHAAVVAAGSPR